MYFLHRSKERSATYISGVSWGKGEERSERGDSGGAPVTTTTTTLFIVA